MEEAEDLFAKKRSSTEKGTQFNQTTSFYGLTACIRLQE
jgi:hypothetical protein